jgi:hypothetical protein
VSSLSLRLSPATAAVVVVADLRAASGEVHQVTFRPAAGRAGTLVATVPPGRWELEALELSEPAGLQITNGHQDAENQAPSTQSRSTVVLGPVVGRAAGGAAGLTESLRSWRAVGAATAARPVRAGVLVQFSDTGQPGVLRPAQPSDRLPVPVLVDPGTAAAADRRGRLTLTVDGLPVSARVAGVLTRFPTLAPGTAGFVVADEATLAAALDAQLPGQGRADELWIATEHSEQLKAALAGGSLAGLGATFRADIEHRLRSAAVARGVLGTLLAAAAVSGALAVLGLLVALLGGARDRRVERDLAAQGLGPRALRRELSLRMYVAAGVGVCVGLLIAALLTRLAVASVQAALTSATPQPPLVTVAPWDELAVWGLAALAALAAATVLATRRTA